jgi:LysM repeat protein
VVKQGETLHQIAQRYSVTVKQLRTWNALRNNQIVPGQRLALLTVRPATAPQRRDLTAPKERQSVAPRRRDQAEPKRRSGPEAQRLTSQFRDWVDSVIGQSQRTGAYALVVNKTDRRMDVYLAGRRVNQFRVAIGHADAESMSDRQVPDDHHLKEGVFHLSEVAWSNSIRKWDRVWMRIHTVEAAKQDYVVQFGQQGRKRLALWEQAHGPIRDDTDVREYNRQHPGQTIWRGLGIHGGGTRWDWTDGCVALDRKNVIWLYRKLQATPNGGVGTPFAVVRY